MNAHTSVLVVTTDVWMVLSFVSWVLTFASRILNFASGVLMFASRVLTFASMVSMCVRIAGMLRSNSALYALIALDNLLTRVSSPSISSVLSCEQKASDVAWTSRIQACISAIVVI